MILFNLHNKVKRKLSVLLYVFHKETERVESAESSAAGTWSSESLKQVSLTPVSFRAMLHLFYKNL